MWTFLGFPTYGNGPFEGWGFPTSTALLVGFVAVCIAEVVVLLWRDATTALWLALALLPVELACWIGFGLPFGPLLGLARTAGGRRPRVRGLTPVGSECGASTEYQRQGPRARKQGLLAARAMARQSGRLTHAG